MLTAALTTIKRFFGIRTDVREATKRPLEEENENEFGEGISPATESQCKKRCSHVDHPLIPNTATDISPVLMGFPSLTWRKENLDPLPHVKMSSHKSEKQKEGSGAEVTIVEERVKKWSVPSRPISLSACGASEEEDDFEDLERKEARRKSELATCRRPLAHTSFADFRFVPSSTMRLMEPHFSAKQKSKYSDWSSSFRSHKSLSRKNKCYIKGSPGTASEKLSGKRRPMTISPSRVIKRSVVHKSFLLEERMKYRQLLQQYTEHYLTPNSKMLSHKVSSVSSSPVEMVARSWWTPFMTKKKQEHLSSSTVEMVARSNWTPLVTKKSQELIENRSSASLSLGLLSSADNSVLEEVFGCKKIDGLDASSERYQKQKNDTIHVPLIDISNEDKEEQDIIERESDGDSVIMIKEVLSPQAQRNSLEERLQEHEFYNLDWIKAMQKEYEDRAYDAQKVVDTTSSRIGELQQRRNKKISLQENVTQRLKLLDLSFPSEYTEITDEEEEAALVPLTPEMENMIDDALNKTPQSEVLIEKFHIQITRRDIRTLDRLNWLNDEVINFYMNLLMERSKENDKYPSTYTFNTFFYPKLSKTGYQSVRRWTKKVDLFTHDLLLIPIHLGMHWCMSVVDLKKKCISYYDSMLSNNEWCLETLLEYLKAEHQDKKGSPYNTSVWKLENKKDIPQQMNGSDCGMFACKFADYLSRRARINFDQQHMPYFRRRMVYEIINARLL